MLRPFVASLCVALLVLTPVNAGAQPPTSTSGSTITPVTGQRKVAVVLLNFAGNPTEPFSLGFARDRVFNPGVADSTNSFFQRSSYGQLSLGGVLDPTGDIFGWITVSYATPGGCRYADWARDADSQLAQSGVDMAAYDHVAYVFPFTTECGWGGFAPTPGRYVYLNGALGGLAHEMGHNLGLSHANGSVCKNAYGFTTEAAGQCTSLQYGDAFDVMAMNNSGGMNVVHRYQLGWLPAEDFQSVTTSGDYTLTNVDSPAGVRGLRIARDLQRGSDSFFLEYRQPADANVSNAGILVHRGIDTSTTTMLVDATPETDYKAQFSDAQLPLGRTFADPDGGVSITPLRTSGDAVTVRVEYRRRATSSPDAAACVSNESPAGAAPKSAFTASVTMKNTGTTTWKAGSYSLGAVTEPSNAWGLDAMALTADTPPGSTATFSGGFTAPDVRPFEMPYVFGWRMRSADGAWFGSPCTKPVAVASYPFQPAAPSDLRTTIVSSNSVTLAWTAPPTAPGESIGNYRVYRVSGSTTYLAALVGAGTTYTDAGLKGGATYSYRVTAMSNNGLESPASVLTVTVPR